MWNEHPNPMARDNGGNHATPTERYYPITLQQVRKPTRLSRRVATGLVGVALVASIALSPTAANAAQPVAAAPSAVQAAHAVPANGIVTSYELYRCWSNRPKLSERSNTYMGSYRQTFLFHHVKVPGKVKMAKSKWKGWNMRWHRTENSGIQIIATRGKIFDGDYQVRVSRCYRDGVYIISA
jgi:hypothetical protein